MTTYEILSQTQNAVSQAVLNAIKPLLPLPVNEIWIVVKIYGIQATFYGPRDREYGACNVDLNRWHCRKNDAEMVTSISIG